MMNYKLGFGAISLLLLTSSVHAIPVYWDVTYYTDDEQVGTGYFGYDSDTSEKVQGYSQKDGNYGDYDINGLVNNVGFPAGSNNYANYSSEALSNLTVSSVVTDAHWVLDNRGVIDTRQWGETYWLPDPENGGLAGQISEPAPSFIFVDETWSGSDHGSSPNYWNTMTWEDYVSDTEATGSWTATSTLDSNDNFYYDVVAGNFVATLRDSVIPAVPVPATLPLFAVGLIGLGFLSRRRA